MFSLCDQSQGGQRCERRVFERENIADPALYEEWKIHIYALYQSEARLIEKREVFPSRKPSSDKSFCKVLSTSIYKTSQTESLSLSYVLNEIKYCKGK